MAITLSEIGYDIIDQVVALKVRDEQRDLVREPREALALAAGEQDFRPLAIYNDDELVGFCMYGTDEEDGRTSIQSLQIDAEHQGKGYSVLALKALVERIGAERNPAALYADIAPGNTGAAKVFAKAGFVQSGEVNDGEQEWVFRY